MRLHASPRPLLLGTVLAAAIAATVSPAHARQIGKDGAFVATAADTVVNQYTTLAASATVGAATLTVASSAGITAGDVLMVYQAQGASISTTNSAAYGAVTALGNAGRYEFVSVAAVSGNTITLGTACGAAPLRFSYDNGAQVVRVPQYSSLTVNAGASIVPQAWNGSTGGVVAAIVDGTATVNGVVHADGRGFRGGVRENQSAASGADIALFSSTDPVNGAEKGESIAGYQATYDSAAAGRYGRGAPANGGGGGNSHNAGGGGGANGGSTVGWNGQGVPDNSNATWAQAWNRDPTLNAATNSPGGGRGGYTYAQNNQDALTLAPGSTGWGGNLRRERGGLGGRPLANNPSTSGNTRLFFGGGGGAGDGNNNSASSGANGGGLVFLLANAVSGSGALRANGATAPNTTGGHNDAPGGGGAGGSVVLIAPSAGGLSASAIGGNGGNQLITVNESEGPGGGGGGGFVAVPGGTATVTGGNNGTTSSAGVTEFIPNGATRGGAGTASAAPARSAVPICDITGISDLQVTKTNTPVSGPSDQAADTVASGATTTYTVVVTNNGPDAVTSAQIVDTPGAGLNCPPATPVTCSSPTAGVCPAAAITVADLAAGIALGALPATAGANTATFVFSCAVQ